MNMRQAVRRASGQEGRFLSVILLLSFLASPASALDRDKAASVVDILETLAQASGETVFYDDLAADEWFELDADDSGLIPAAGFGRESWKEAYGQMLKGLIASIPMAEIDEVFGNAEEKIAALPGLSDNQKREAVHEWRVKQAEIAAIRAEGKAYMTVVTPFAPRMMKIMKAF
jgi:hypothetical protein